ncbi:hypothetical protein [Streptomyces sp. NPDC087294]|uniref:hypothetical protein n=1 Tax=Streptomyces sp. NPDC087294 TaxID=3365777 RepID=UPI00380878C3
MTTPAAQLPDSSTQSWGNSAHVGLQHFIAYTKEKGVQLYTGGVDAATNTFNWAVENRWEIMDSAIRTAPAMGLALQAIGTARGDASEGVRSAYNWGVAISGGNGLYTIGAQLNAAFNPNSERPGSIPQIALGSLEAGGAIAYGMGTNPTVQAAGAGIQALGSGVQSVVNDFTRKADAEVASRNGSPNLVPQIPMTVLTSPTQRANTANVANPAQASGYLPQTNLPQPARTTGRSAPANAATNVANLQPASIGAESSRAGGQNRDSRSTAVQPTQGKAPSSRGGRGAGGGGGR